MKKYLFYIAILLGLAVIQASIIPALFKGFISPYLVLLFILAAVIFKDDFDEVFVLAFCAGLIMDLISLPATFGIFTIASLLTALALKSLVTYFFESHLNYQTFLLMLLVSLIWPIGLQISRGYVSAISVVYLLVIHSLFLSLISYIWYVRTR